MVKFFIPITVFAGTLALLCSTISYANADLSKNTLGNFNQSPNYQKNFYDLTGDGQLERFELQKGILKVNHGNITLWQSPKSWHIDSFAIADATHDGKHNLVLSLWKSGNFGPSKPFWEDTNDPSIKNHLFIYEFQDDNLHQVWGSSNLSQPNCEFTFNDIDHDNKQELIVIEGLYTDNYQCQGQFLAVWKWEEWGFFNEWRSKPGDYQDINSLLPAIKEQYN
ncbi:hypothetical protein KKF61_05495 [Patescibacteria group bacterium]|nr:hypothetical protein [Patescibacteria group bacterium]MBU0963521.1 hypothetical protein [Patescibacteria group bacterium]